MVARRSKRDRKKINYAAFGDGNDFDDDFADPTPPSKKKTSLSSNKENKGKSKNPEKSDKVEKKKAGRLSVDEKLYERQLQEALNLSLGESQGSSDGDAVNLVDTPPLQTQVSVTVESRPVEADVSTPKCGSVPVDTEITKSRPSEDVPPTEQKVITSAKRPAEDITDEIQILEADVSSDEQPSKRRRVTSGAAKKSKYVDSDSEGSEFEADSDSDDEFDDDDGDDSDFDAETESKKKGKTKAPSPAKKKEPIAKTSKPKPSTAPKESKLAPKAKTPSASAKNSAARKSYTSPVSAAVPARVSGGLSGRKTVCTPPVQASSCKSSLGGSSMTSPTSGIRLGLSRNQRVKPLHPSLSVQH